MAIWNPWHGCHRISPGCQNCYVYRRDASVGKDAGIVTKTGDYDLPRKKNRQREYKLVPAGGTVYTCMTSDFFLEEADAWRPECWKMMKERPDLDFVIITKRIGRLPECIPDDWGNGYPNVTIYCTAENQKMADVRLPVFLRLPVRHKCIIHEPMLGPVDISAYLASGQIESVICGGESGPDARPCHYDWILSVREQCIRYGAGFHFKQTGAVFIKDGRIFRIERRLQEIQAAKAGIDFSGSRETAAGIPEESADRRPEILPPEMPDEKKQSHEEWLKEDLLQRVAASPFRSRFRLKAEDKQYVREKGMALIRSHAEDFIEKRLAPAEIPNDGKQTPMRGHPVFPAQHACSAVDDSVEGV